MSGDMTVPCFLWNLCHENEVERALSGDTICISLSGKT